MPVRGRCAPRAPGAWPRSPIRARCEPVPFMSPVHEREGAPMRIEVKGRNTPITDELTQRIEQRFDKVAKQVSLLAEVEVGLRGERNPPMADSQAARVPLPLKAVTLRARGRSRAMAPP